MHCTLARSTIFSLKENSTGFVKIALTGGDIVFILAVYMRSLDSPRGFGKVYFPIYPRNLTILDTYLRTSVSSLENRTAGYTVEGLCFILAFFVDLQIKFIVRFSDKLLNIQSVHLTLRQRKCQQLTSTGVGNEIPKNHSRPYKRSLWPRRPVQCCS